MDALSDVLQTLRLRGSLYCRADLAAPWGLYFKPAPVAVFHVVSEGGCLLQREGEAEPLRLGGGDVVVLPRGDGHHIMGGPGSPTLAVVQLGQEIRTECQSVRNAAGNGETTLLCGTFDIEHRASHPLLALLPPLLYLPGEHGRPAPALEPTLTFLAAEALATQPGAQTVLTRLADVLFIQVLRHWIAHQAEGQAGWLGALHDRQISEALGLIHRHPEREWSVASLAAAVAMSRSSFAARFTALVGTAPLAYLTSWRMRRAADLLGQGNVALAEVAHRVGYRSEFAFSKAFKRAHGMAPRLYRRQVVRELGHIAVRALGRPVGLDA